MNSFDDVRLDLEEEDKTGEELLTIEINYGEDQVDEIVVHYGDNPDELAEVFLFFHFTLCLLGLYC